MKKAERSLTERSAFPVDSFLQKLYAAIFDVVHRPDDPQTRFFLNVVDAQALFFHKHSLWFSL